MHISGVTEKRRKPEKYLKKYWPKFYKFDEPINVQSQNLGKAQEEYEVNYTKSHNNLSFKLHDKEKKSQNRQKKITYGRTIITVIKDFLAEIMRF